MLALSHGEFIYKLKVANSQHISELHNVALNFYMTSNFKHNASVVDDVLLDY